MEMIFTGAAGTVRMDGGGGNAPIKILNAEGLGFLTQRAVTAACPFIGGQRTLSRLPGARLITVSAEAAESGVNYEGALAAIVYESGRLEIAHGGRRVYAECYVSDLKVTRARGGDFERYVFQFTCDYPYFRDCVPSGTGLFQRTKLIKNSFTLPTVFSKRVTGGELNVSGDRDVLPKITVSGLDNEEEFPLEIVNETTGASLKLNLPAGEYGLIVFDLHNGRIYCGQQELTGYLDENSFMSDFYLIRGNNRLNVKAMDVSVNTSASVTFENEYFSAWEDTNAQGTDFLRL